MGLPTVAFKAPYVHCIGDQVVFTHLGMPDWLLTTTDEQYFQTAKRLITDPAALSELRTHILSLDRRSLLFSDKQDDDPADFLETISWIYHNHEAIQASSSRCFQRDQALPA